MVTLRRRRLWAAWTAVTALLAACTAVGWMVVRVGVSGESGRWIGVLVASIGVSSIVGGVIVSMTVLGRAYTVVSERGIRQWTLRGWQVVTWGEIVAVGVERRPGQEVVAVEAPGRVIHIDTQYFDRERLMTCLSAREVR